MATTNRLPQAAKNTSIIEYDSNGEKVKLSPATVRAYLVSGQGAVTDQEVAMFMSLCKYQHLNPFLREAYLIKYGTSPATIVTGKDVFTKRANRNPRYEGKQAGIIVLTQDGRVAEREGTFKLPAEQIVGGWAKVYIKGQKAPEYAAVSFDEYAGRKSNGELNSQWASKPATMIRKVALVQALREAFPEDFQGLYSPEEIPAATAMPLDETAVEVREATAPRYEPEKAMNAPDTVEIPPEAEKPVETPESALFG